MLSSSSPSAPSATSPSRSISTRRRSSRIRPVARVFSAVSTLPRSGRRLRLRLCEFHLSVPDSDSSSADPFVRRMEELSKTKREDHTLKTLVFSQFTTMLYAPLALSHPAVAHSIPPLLQRPRCSSSPARQVEVRPHSGYHDSHRSRQHDQGLHRRPRVHRLPHLPQGGRSSAQLGRGQPSHHVRSLVEPRCRGNIQWSVLKRFGS